MRILNKLVDTKSPIFVKGFAQSKDFDKLIPPEECHGNFFAIVTNLIISDYLEITAATRRTDGKWMLKCTNGTIHILEDEPKTPRKMECGKLVTNYTRSVFGDTYDVVSVSDDIIEKISTGDTSTVYQLVGYINHHEVVTSDLVKLWHSDGKFHALTISGSHYTF